MRRLLVLALACVASPLAGCHDAPEDNVEVKAEKTSRALEERHNQIEAEAANSAEAGAAPFDNEAEGLLNQMAGNAAAPANGAARP